LVRFADTLGFMPLERIHTYRLVRVLRIVVPFLILAVITIPAWNYWSRRTQIAMPELPKDFPKDLSISTNGVNYVQTENGRTLFTVRAASSEVFKTNRQMLEDVDVTVYGETDTEAPKRVRSLHADYDAETLDIRFIGNVEVDLDEKTRAHTEELRYNHRDRLINSDHKTFIEQPGRMEAEANQLEYAFSSGRLKLDGDVKVRMTDGTRLETGSAIFSRDEKRVMVSNGVSLESPKGRLRGSNGNAELEGESLRPRVVVVEGNVTADSRGTGPAWDLEADWVQALIAPDGNAQRLLARGNVRATKSTDQGKQSLTGKEVDATLAASGDVDVLEARHNAQMVLGSDRTLSSSQIRANAAGVITTEDDSVLDLGESRIAGRGFEIRQGDIVTFETKNRATLQSGGRVTAADRTEGRFDSKTNLLIGLVQTGNFEFREGTRHGQSQLARVEDSGNSILLEGASSFTDGGTRMDAAQIRLNQKMNSFVAIKDVKTVTMNGTEKLLVKAERAEGDADTVVYTGGVQLWRGDAWISAQRLEASSRDNRFRATGSVQSRMNNVRASSDALDYDDAQKTALYTGKVRAQQRKMVVETDNMTVNITGDAVSRIVARRNVVIKQGTQQGAGNEATYDAATETVVLTGSPAEFVDKVQGVVRGPRLLIYTSGDKMAVQTEGLQRTTTKYKVQKNTAP
jgi:LPS export ABC transporter protein LptC/lipopolysaccharide transport protein LptA